MIPITMHMIRRGVIYATSAAIIVSTGLAEAGTGALANPLNPAVSTISTFIEGALKAMVMVALPILTVFIVFSGFRFILAQGNQEALKKAQTNFKFVIIGTVLVLGAWTISSILVSTVTQVIGH